MSAPIPRIVWPFDVVTGTNDLFKFRYPTGGGGVDYTVTIPAAVDTWAMTAPIVGPEADDLARAIELLVEAACPAANMTIRVTADGHVWFNDVTDAFDLYDAGDGSTIAPWLGITDTVTGSDDYTSQVQHRCGWYPELPVETDTFPLVGIVDVQTTIARSGVQRTHCSQAQADQRDIGFAWLPMTKVFAAPYGYSASTYVYPANEAADDPNYGLFQRLAAGKKVYWFDDTRALYLDWPAAYRRTYVNRDVEWAKRFDVERHEPGLDLYKFNLALREYVAP